MTSAPTAFGIVAVLAVAGCKQPTIDPVASGQVVVTPGPPNARLLFNSDGSQITVDFGPVVIGNTALETFSLTNVGSQDMTFLKVSTEVSDPSFSTDLQQGQKLVAGGAAVPVAVRFTPQSLGTKGAKIVVTTDSSIVPTIELTLGGQGASRLSLVLSPTTIDFGKVLVNTTAQQTLMLTNQCGAVVSPTLEAIQGPDARLFATVPATGAVLALPDQEAGSLTISFSPVVASPTPFHGTFAVPFCYVDGGDCAPSVALLGVGVSTCLRFSPAPLAFGSVPTGQSITKVVTLSNDCTNGTVHLIAPPAVLNDLPDGGTATTGAFQPGTAFPNNSASIGPGQSLDFPITFNSSSVGTFAGELIIATDDPTNSEPVVLLTATAGP